MKVLHGQFASGLSRKERFFRGARQMKQLRHAGIVDVIEEYCYDKPYYFFVMEYVPGGDLRQAVLRGQLREGQKLDLIRGTGEALAFAHERGVIHRDVKPANILIDDRLRPKLADFDLVQAYDSTGGTRTGGMLGTFLFAAPEVLLNAKNAREASDVFGLGMSAVFALYGADLPLTMLRNLDEHISNLQCSEPIRHVLRQAVEWDASARIASVEEFLSKLGQAREGARVGLLSDGSHRQIPRRAVPRNRWPNASRSWAALRRSVSVLLEDRRRRGFSRRNVRLVVALCFASLVFSVLRLYHQYYFFVGVAERKAMDFYVSSLYDRIYPASDPSSSLSTRRLSPVAAASPDVGEPVSSSEELLGNKATGGAVDSGELVFDISDVRGGAVVESTIFEVYFKDNISEAASDDFDESFGEILRLLNSHPGCKVVVEGHAEPLGVLKAKQQGLGSYAVSLMEQNAKELSRKRAETIKRAFVHYARQRGFDLDSSRLTAVGLGVSQPKFDPPRTKEEWAKNRRVVLRIQLPIVD